MQLSERRIRRSMFFVVISVIKTKKPIGRRLVCQGENFISVAFWDDPTQSAAAAFTPHGRPQGASWRCPLGAHPWRPAPSMLPGPAPRVTSRRQVSREPPAGAGARGSGAPRGWGRGAHPPTSGPAHPLGGANGSLVRALSPLAACLACK